MLRRVSVSLVELQRDNQRRFAENENILSEVRNEVLEMRRQHADDIAEMRRRTDTLVEQTADLKRLSNIHSKSILKLLKKI